MNEGNGGHGIDEYQAKPKKWCCDPGNRRDMEVSRSPHGKETSRIGTDLFAFCFLCCSFFVFFVFFFLFLFSLRFAGTRRSGNKQYGLAQIPKVVGWSKSAVGRAAVSLYAQIVARVVL